MASNLDLAEQLVPHLRALLQGWADEGVSYDQMAASLGAMHGIDVSRETVRRWCKHYGIEKGA
jgi:intein-encoded DNA endonuclease-like protein